jgi:hypothetical protein
MPPNSTSWRSILILSYKLSPGIPSGLFPSGFPTETLYAPLLSPIRTTCPAYPILLDLITRIIFSEGYQALNFSLCNFLHSPVTSSLFSRNILNTLSLHSSLNVSGQVTKHTNVPIGLRETKNSTFTEHRLLTVKELIKLALYLTTGWDIFQEKPENARPWRFRY